ncbi:EamA family transporter [Emticicia sp. SJ17W-69]|uniref:EamA family transporter n=1 Tax=Emticicia sp. SJ17W-69 TaxID=3421657 RepID=UPI003EBD6981
MSQKTKIFIALGVVYIVWGSTYLGVKYAIVVLPPMLVSCTRFLIGGTLLFIFTLLRGEGFPSMKHIRNAAFIGVLLSGVGNCAVAYALRFMPSGLVALLVATLPAWMILLDFLFFSNQKPTLIGSIGLVLGLVGMAFLLNPAQQIGQREVSLLPALVVFGGSVAWAFGSLKSPYLSLPRSLQSTAIQMIVGGCFSLSMSLIFEKNQLQALQSMTQQTYLAMIYLVIVGSYVGYTAYVWLINNAPPQLTATYAYVNPVVAIFLGWIFLDERLTSRSLTASAIILAGVILMTLGRRKKAKEIDNNAEYF